MQGDWNHSRFVEAADRVEAACSTSRPEHYVSLAEDLYSQCRAAGPEAYNVAVYDLAYSCWLLGRARSWAGHLADGYRTLQEARDRFDLLQRRFKRQAAYMASVVTNDQADCLRSMGRLGDAVRTYEDAIRRAEILDDARQVAVNSFQLATTLNMKGESKRAIDLATSSREFFEAAGEHANVAGAWHQMGTMHEEGEQYDQALDAYERSLAIRVHLESNLDRSVSLDSLCRVLVRLGRLDEAVARGREAVELALAARSAESEGTARHNLSLALESRGDYGEARAELHKAIERKVSLGNRGEVWKSWALLQHWETEAGDSGRAAEAGHEAYDTYLSYRQAGGEEQGTSVFWREFWKLMSARDPATMADAAGIMWEAFAAAGVSTAQGVKYLALLDAAVRGESVRSWPSYVDAVEVQMIAPALQKPSGVSEDVMPSFGSAQTSVITGKYVRSLARPGLRYHFFLSYSSSDSALAEELCASLQTRGFRVFLDRDRGEHDKAFRRKRDEKRGAPIEGGDEEVGKVLSRELNEAWVFLLLVSDATLGSDWVSREYSRALDARMPILIRHTTELVGAAKYEPTRYAFKRAAFDSVVGRDRDEQLILGYLDRPSSPVDDVTLELCTWLELVEYTLWKGEPALKQTVARYAREHATWRVKAAELRARVALEHQFWGSLERSPGTDLIPAPDSRWKRYKPWVVREVEHWTRFLADEEFRSREIAHAKEGSS